MYIFALGGNADYRSLMPNAVLQRGFAALQHAHIGAGWRLSPLYRTPAFPAGSGPDFANAVAVCEQPEVAPGEALARAHAIEAEFGRTRTVRWGARTLDIDLIAAGGVIAPDRAIAQHWRDLGLDAQTRDVPSELILPHPRIADRAFVLVPLVDVAPSWVDPLSGKTAPALLAARPAEERATVVPWT